MRCNVLRWCVPAACELRCWTRCATCLTPPRSSQGREVPGAGSGLYGGAGAAFTGAGFAPTAWLRAMRAESTAMENQCRDRDCLPCDVTSILSFVPNNRGGRFDRSWALLAFACAGIDAGAGVHQARRFAPRPVVLSPLAHSDNRRGCLCVRRDDGLPSRYRSAHAMGVPRRRGHDARTATGCDRFLISRPARHATGGLRAL